MTLKVLAINTIKTPSSNVKKNTNLPKPLQKLAFKNWAPEVINGRCAMLGFVSGKGYEIVSGVSVFDQPHMFESFLVSSVLITVGSLITGDPEESEYTKPFTPTVEMLNGRLAMLGILFSLF
jgi:hypothetical protein